MLSVERRNGLGESNERRRLRNARAASAQNRHANSHRASVTFNHDEALTRLRLMLDELYDHDESEELQ